MSKTTQNRSSEEKEYVEYIDWKLDEEIPAALQFLHRNGIASSMVLPRPLSWLSTEKSRVCLLNGYTAVCYTPPTLIVSASSLPESERNHFLQEKAVPHVCTLSLATTRDPLDALEQCLASQPSLFSVADIGLESAKNVVTIDGAPYPPAVAASPLHMYCTFREKVVIEEDDDDAIMILLTVEKFVMHGTILVEPTPEMVRSRPNVTAKVDAKLMAPMVAISPLQCLPLSEVRSMARPSKPSNDGTGEWTSTDLQLPPKAKAKHNGTAVEWNFRTDGRTCPALGCNPVTTLIMPRPIGWISTFSKTRVPHIAPYSFFTSIGNRYVCFSGYSANGAKDAQTDVETMGCFCCNLVGQEMAKAMNYTASELSCSASEFELAQLPWKTGKWVDAPVVQNAQVRLECAYVKTLPAIGGFSVVIGRMQGVSMNPDMLSNENEGATLWNVEKLRPLVRLGYADEYGLFG